jgi:hypothetical protein
MKVIVYTVNIGGYDKLNPSPKVIWQDSADFEYLYFTDGEAPAGWKKVEIKKGDRKASRFWKINSHLLPPHDISIYLDACYCFKKDIKELPDLLEADIAVCKHPEPDVWSHAITCLWYRLDDPKVIFNQMGRYSDLPEHILTENSLIIRKNNVIIQELNEIWWDEYLNGSQRDQLSLPYALWKSQANLQILPFSARDNDLLDNWANHLQSHEWKQ